MVILQTLHLHSTCNRKGLHPAVGNSAACYTSQQVHSNAEAHASYIDCVRFLGDMVVSKGIDGTIRIWTPDMVHNPEPSRGQIHLVQVIQLTLRLLQLRFQPICSHQIANVPDPGSGTARESTDGWF